jgi:hypothetical protein
MFSADRKPGVKIGLGQRAGQERLERAASGRPRHWSLASDRVFAV